MQEGEMFVTVSKVVNGEVVSSTHNFDSFFQRFDFRQEKQKDRWYNKLFGIKNELNYEIDVSYAMMTTIKSALKADMEMKLIAIRTIKKFNQIMNTRKPKTTKRKPGRPKKQN
jgi:hypothetical protein